jgi:protein SHQ1
MIRPIFNVSQDDSFIYIEAKVKYIKISDFEYFIEDNNFRFSLKPYYLNINLPKKLNSESKLNSFTYEPENEKLICKIEKLNIGENFENLQFISTLYENNKSNNDKILSGNKKIFSKIEEIPGGNSEEKIIEENIYDILIINNEKDLNEFLFNKYTKEKNKKNNLENLSENIKENNDYKYGFNNIYFDVFDKRKEELLELCDLNPKDVPIQKRYLYKLQKENNDFNSERYVTDIFLDDKNSDFFDEFFCEMIKNNLDKKDKKFLESITDKKSKDNFDEIENEVLFKISKLKITDEKNI